jgi:hemoglobin
MPEANMALINYFHQIKRSKQIFHFKINQSMDNTVTSTQKSLYERLGGEASVRKIANDVLDKNLSNPLISYHFEDIDMDKLKQLVFEFFSMGTGGPHNYTGRDMRTAHTGMKINEEEWISGADDMISVMNDNGVGEGEKKEVLAIFDSLKGDIVGV